MEKPKAEPVLTSGEEDAVRIITEGLGLEVGDYVLKVAGSEESHVITILPPDTGRAA